MKIFFLILIFLLGLISLNGDSLEDLEKEEKTELYGSEKRKKFKSTAVFWEIEDWENHYSTKIFWIYKKTDYPRFYSKKFIPFYYSIQSKTENLNKFRFLNYQSSKILEREKTAFFPFYFSEKNKETNENTTLLLPLYYFSRNIYEDKKNSSFISPIFIHESIQSKDLNREYHFSFFHFHSQNLTNKEKTNFYPILPLVYRNTNSENSHSNYLWIFDYKYSGENLERMFLAPLFFYKNYGSEKSIFISPLYYKNRDPEYSEELYGPIYHSKNSGNDSGYLHFFPIYFSGNEKNESGESKFSLSPLHFSYQKDGDAAYKRIFFPILPLVYSYNSEKENHKNLFWLFDYKLNDGNLERIFLAPIFYRDQSETKKNLIVLNYLSSSNSEMKETYNWLFPFYFHTQKSDSETTNLLGLYHNYENSTQKSSFRYFLPFLYFSIKDEIKDMTILGPFVSHKPKTENGITSTNLYPFYFSTEEPNGSSKSSLLGLYFNHKNENKEIEQTYLFPFYGYKKDQYLITPVYMRFGKPEDEYRDLRGPFYYFSENEDSKTSYALLYYNKLNKQDNTHLTTIFPLYWDWKSKESSGTFYPWYFKKTNQNNEVFDINILGLASSAKNGSFYTDVDLGEKEGHYYLDTDISWFHSLFQLKTRISSNQTLLFGNGNSDPKNTSEIESPSISNNRKFDRENSFNFWGWNALFYLAAYEAGDTKRHIRVFPLAWFTWDTEKEDRVYMLPPLLPIFFRYISEETEYSILFPFLGKQKTPEENIDSYLLFTYISESRKENNHSEKSVVWPLINWYDSDFENGYRIAPIYWEKNSSGGLSNLHRSFSPVHFIQSETSNYSKDRKQIFLSWLYYSSENSGEKYSSRKRYSPFYISNTARFEKEDIHYDISSLFLPFFYKSSEVRKDSQNEILYDNHTFLSPIYISNYVYSEKPLQNYWYIFPLLYRSDLPEEKYTNFLLAFSSKQTDRLSEYAFTPVLPVFLYRRDKDEDENSNKTDYFLTYYSNSISDPNGKEIKSKNLFFPFYYHSFQLENREGKEHSSTHFLSPLYLSSESDSKKWWFLTLPLLYHSKSSNESYWNFLLFTDYSNTENSSKFDVTPIVPFISFENTQTGTHRETKKYFFPYYSYRFSDNEDNEKEILDFLFLLDYRYNKSKESTRSTHWYFPFFQSEYQDIHGNEKKIRFLLPVFRSHFEKNAESKMETTFNPFYYSKEISIETSQETYEKFYTIPLLYKYKNLNDEGGRLFLFVKWANSDLTEESYVWPILPLYYQFQKKNSSNSIEISKKWWLFFYHDYRVDESQTNEFFSIPFLFLKQKRTESLKDEDGQSEESNFFSFPYISKNKVLPNHSSHTTLFPLLGYYRKSEDNSATNRFLYSLFYLKNSPKDFTTYIWPILPLFYHNSTEEENYFHFLGVFDYKFNKPKNKVNRFYTFPYWYSSNQEETYHHLMPFVFTYKNKETSSGLSFGYYYRYNTIGFRNNFLFLYDHRYQFDSGKRDLSFLFHSINYSYDSSSTHLDILHFLVRYNKNSEYLERKFLWMGYSEEKTRFQWNFLPIYGFFQEEQKRTQVFLPLLGYSNWKSEEERNFLGLGLLYYHSRSDDKKEELRHFLLGTLYYENKKPKNHYRSKGSLWGWLWQYEEEMDTHWKKVSIFKIFSLEESENEKRIMGIKY
ncbi:MAG: hypothetical protein KDK54_16165 [Leptospiraceae bacterium]|nr:hypothetical protein [Leptospiraceae bacterium]